MQLGSEVLLQLRRYAGAFLEASYNILMGSIRKDLEAGLHISRLSAEDFLRFFRLASFFTSFVRQQQACSWTGGPPAEGDVRCEAHPVRAALSLPRHAQEQQHLERRRHHQGARGDGEEASPFSCISATMGWETFYMVQSLWLSVIDLPAAAPAASGDKWALQVGAARRLMRTSTSHAYCSIPSALTPSVSPAACQPGAAEGDAAHAGPCAQHWQPLGQEDG